MGDEDAFMGGGAKTFTFDTVGDEVTGEILSIKERQQTDMDTGELAFWPDGKPKMMFTFELATRIREDEDDDGVRSINVRWKSQEAIKAAVRAAGAKKPLVGGTLSLKFTGELPPTKKGFSKTKLWAAKYVAPDPGSGFMDDHSTVEVAARPGQRQARNVDHRGQPQDQDVPEWGRQPQGATAPQQEMMARLGRSQQAAISRLPDGPDFENERQHFGF